MTTKSIREWHDALRPFTRASDTTAWAQVLGTGLAFALLYAVGLWSLSGPYWITIVIACFLGALTARLFILQHDCGHGSLFTTQGQNDWVGRSLGVLTLMPYESWYRGHAAHHAGSGNLARRTGDIITLTVEEYKALGFWGRLGYRSYRNIAVLLLLGPFWEFVVHNRLPVDHTGLRKGWRSIMATNLALGAVALAFAQTIGLHNWLLLQVPVTLIAGALGMWLFFVQHQYEEAYWRQRQDWSFVEAALLGSSVYALPRPVEWFLARINLHSVHHLQVAVPNYRLRECLEAVFELRDLPRLTFWRSVRDSRLALWDAKRGRLVSFGQIRSLV